MGIIVFLVKLALSETVLFYVSLEREGCVKSRFWLDGPFTIEMK
jgi:hypothetical protein